MLEYDYTKRLTANECLKTEWITRKHNRTLEEVPIPNDITEVKCLGAFSLCLSLSLSLYLSLSLSLALF